MENKSPDKQILKILDTVKQFAAGDYSGRIMDQFGRDLFNELAHSVNILGEELEVKQQERVAETVKFEESLKALQENRKEVLDEKIKYKSLADNIKLGIYRSRGGAGGEFVEVNPAMVGIFGFENKEALLAEQPGNLWWNLSEREKLFKKLRKNSFVISEEVELRKKGGIKIICSLSVTVVLDESGKPLYYDGVVEDISQTRSIESRLSKNAEILRSITEASQDMIFQLNQEGSFVYCSPYSEMILGYSCEQILHSRIEDYISSEEYLKVHKIFSKVLSGKKIKPFELSVRHKNGKNVNLEISFIPLTQENGVPVVQGIARDISEQKLSRQALQQERDYAETVQRMMPSGLFTVNNDLEVTSWNNMAAAITGYEPHEIIGKKCTILKGDQCGERCGFTSPDIEKPIIGSICTIQSKTGRKMTLRKNVDLLRDENGKVIGGIESFEDISEQLATQQALEKENSLMSMLLNHIPDRMYFKDLESRFIRVSKSTAVHHGFEDPVELVGKTNQDLNSGKNSDEAFRNERYILETGKPVIDVEEREIWEDGKETWALSSKMPMFDKQGKLIGTFGISSDITGRKRAEEQLRGSRALLDVTGRMAKVGGWELDVEKQTVSWTEETYRIHELPLDSKPVLEDAMKFYHPDDRTKLDNAIARAIKFGEPYDLEVRFITAKGRHLWTKTMCTPIRENGVSVKLLGTFQDITDQKALREETREREELLDKITGSAQDAIVVIDNHGNVVFWNSSAEKIFGYKEDEISGRNFHDLLVREAYHEAHRKGFNRFKKHGKGNAIGTTLELDAMRKNGQNFPVELSLSGVNVKGEWHAVGIIRDTTERKESERKLEEARAKAESANRAKSEFLANMSHEIRTPMNAILGFSEILEEKLQDKPEQYEYIKVIRNSGKGLLGLINDILDLSKIEAGRLDISYEAINPFAIIEEIRQIFLAKTSEKKLDFLIHVDSNLPNCLLFDETRMRQVLFNLIGNAIKFTSEGGVTVNVRSEDSNEEQSHVDIFIEVIDTGIGIPEKELKLIFEPFRQKEGQSTRKYGGTGLGLSITQRLVAIMGGTLEVSSTPGEGSVFTVFMPGIQVAVLKETGQDQNEVPGKVAFENQTILLVEDIESNRKVIAGYLGSQHINIVVAENGSIGVDMAREVHPDLILMDMQMPVMDGYEATRLIKMDKKLKQIPVVALTASTMKTDEQKIMDLCDGYLRKPVTKLQLISELKKYLAHTEAYQELEGSASQTDSFFTALISRLTNEHGLVSELLPTFNDEIIPEFEVLLKNRSNKRIRSFAELLIRYGAKLDLKEFESFGKELHIQLGAFNIKMINIRLEEFTEFSEHMNALHTKTKNHG